MKIKNYIKLYRKQKGLSQKELADRSGISERNIRSIESGKQEPRISTTLRITKVLNTKVEELFTLEDEDSPSKNSK